MALDPWKAAALLGLPAGLAQPALAQDAAPASPGEDIVVTAQKREQALADVPLAVSAFTARALDDAGVVSTKDLADLVPSLRIPNESPSGSGNGFVFMRGIGTDNTQYTLDPAVGIYIDGVYFARAYGTIFDLFDVERIEVLRGPQGTLYGRNNSAGAIKLISRAPPLDGTDLGARIGYGYLNELRGEASVGTALARDSLGLRLSVTHRQNDGYQTNLLNPNDKAQSVNFTGLNAAVLLKPAEAVSITLRFNEFRERGDAIQNIPLGAPNRRVFEGNLENLNRVTNRGLSATIEADLGSELMLTSITAHRWVDLDAAFNLDGVGTFELEAPLQQIRSRYWTQEAYVSGRTGADARLEWVAGLFLYSEKITEDALLLIGPGVLAPLLPAIPVPSDRIFNAHAFSVYGQGTLYVGSSLGFTAGLRWTNDRKDYQDRAIGISPRRFSDDNVTWRLAVEWKPQDALLVYASASSGFRAGGFDINTGDPFPTETARAIELGVKGSAAGQRVRFAAAYFHTRFDSLQQSVIDISSPTGLATTFFDATAQGLEFEGSFRPTNRLTLGASLATLATDPKVDVPTAKDLKQSPKFSGRFSALYRVPLASGAAVTLGGAYTYTSSYFLDPENTPAGRIDAAGILDARAAFQTADGRWEFALDGRNLTGETSPPFKFRFPFPGLTAPVTEFNRSPRSWMVTATYRY